MKHQKYYTCYIVFFALALSIASCEKVNISFGASPSATDPNITYFDNYYTTIATFKPDSFLASDHKVFSVGYHYDPVFGVVKAGSYVQLTLPDANPLLNITETLIYDSLEVILKPSGLFYGDSTRPIRINVHRMLQPIANSYNTDVNYNTTSFNYDPVPLGSRTVIPAYKTGSAISVRLSDALGQELFSKFKNNENEITTPEFFLNYFNGLYITSDSVITNSLAYFTETTDSVLFRLNYHQNGTTDIAKSIDFVAKESNQFNNINIRPVNPNFAAFLPNKRQVIESAASGNQAFLNSNMNASIKISFPTLLNLKELHPYIKVVKAELVIRPDIRSYTKPYQLPATLNLYNTDAGNELLTGIFEPGSSGSAMQTGNLVVDNLYDKDTYYSFDITEFINNKITEGESSTSALLLYPTVESMDKGVQRLIVNDQNNSTRPIQLKLYVLGL